MTKIHFTSDVHIGHKRLWEQFCPERRVRWPVWEEYTDGLVERWNQHVAPEDTVYSLGDFSFVNADRTRDVIKRLNGKIHFIRGNHDQVVDKNVDIRNMFASYQDMLELRVDHADVKLPIVLFHYPIMEWNRMHYGALHLYGHVHGSLPVRGRSVDVGFDSPHITGKAEHRPYSLDEVVERLKNEPILAHN